MAFGPGVENRVDSGGRGGNKDENMKRREDHAYGWKEEADYFPHSAIDKRLGV